MRTHEIINGSVWHVLNFIMQDLIAQGFMLAQEDELSYLKGLVDPCALAEHDEETRVCTLDVELEMLHSLEDEGVKIIMLSIERIREFIKTYMIIQALELEDVLMEEDMYEHAVDVFYQHRYDMECPDAYERILWDTLTLYTLFEIIIFHLILTMKHEDTDVGDLVDDQFWEYTRISIEFDNASWGKKPELLFDLLNGLQEDSILLNEYYYLLREKENGKV